jgi:hypothetical protein
MNFNQQNDTEGEIKIESNILQMAINNDQKALISIFKQFLPDDETIYSTQYLGLQGIWGFGTRNFVCLTERRIADITIARFGEVTYQDGYLDAINSCIVYQPSKLNLYILIGLSAILAFWSFGITLLILPFSVQGYYRLVKCGIVFTVKGGIPVYMFSNRKYLSRANTLCKHVSIARESRIKTIKKMHST